MCDASAQAGSARTFFRGRRVRRRRVDSPRFSGLVLSVAAEGGTPFPVAS